MDGWLDLELDGRIASDGDGWVGPGQVGDLHWCRWDRQTVLDAWLGMKIDRWLGLELDGRLASDGDGWVRLGWMGALSGLDGLVGPGIRVTQ